MNGVSEQTLSIVPDMVSQNFSECLSIFTQIMIAGSITSLPSFLFQNTFQNIITIDVIIVILLANIMKHTTSYNYA